MPRPLSPSSDRPCNGRIPALLVSAWVALLGAVLPAQAQILIRDDAGNELSLPGPARRIVSLAPHITETLFAAGAGERIVGAVAHSDYPLAARKLPVVGGYNNIDIEAVIALRPDLVIAWQSGNRNAHLDRITALGIPVYVNEALSIEGVARSLEAFGRLAGTDTSAREAARHFRGRATELAARYRDRPPVRMFYQIWNTPLMTVNGEHLISDVMRLCGGQNVFADLPMLAPRISVEAVLAADPEAIVASGMNATRPEWLDQWRRWPGLAANAHGNLYFIDPDLIQRHTPRILDGASLLCDILDAVREKRRQPSVSSREDSRAQR